MQQQGRWPRLLGRLALAAGLWTGAGCHHLLHHEVEQPPHVVLRCQDLHPCCRDHVHIFIIHGTDPLDFANLNGLNAYLRDLGFRKTYLGQLYHRNDVTREVRRVHAADPEARFVLIGFSLGANMVRDVTQTVKPDGVHIDLLVYLGGNTLEDGPRDRPENCGRLINILAKGCIWNGTTFADGENIHLPDVFHFGSPMHPHTRELLAAELAEVGARVPILVPAGQMPGGPLFEEPTPAPRAVPAAAPAARDEWDFLKPAAQLQPPEVSTEFMGAARARSAAGPADRSVVKR